MLQSLNEVHGPSLDSFQYVHASLLLVKYHFPALDILHIVAGKLGGLLCCKGAFLACV